MSDPIPLTRMQVARTWQEAADGILTDLIRFATFRGLGFDVEMTAVAMNVTLPLAERYETAITSLIADLHSEAAPEAPGAAPDPKKGIRQ